MASDSWTSWVTTIEAASSASFRSRMRLPVTASEIGSSPVNGSSYMMSAGSSAIARASATRRCMPPESCCGMRSAAPRSPTAWSFISTRSRISGSGRLRALAHREGDVVERGQIGEERAELEQHSHLAPQRVELAASGPD